MHVNINYKFALRWYLRAPTLKNFLVGMPPDPSMQSATACKFLETPLPRMGSLLTRLNTFIGETLTRWYQQELYQFNKKLT